MAYWLFDELNTLVLNRSPAVGIHRYRRGNSLVVIDPDDADVKRRVVYVQLDPGFRALNLYALLNAAERVEGSPEYVVAGFAIHTG